MLEKGQQKDLDLIVGHKNRIAYKKVNNFYNLSFLLF
jgi:hypothetical protein